MKKLLNTFLIGFLAAFMSSEPAIGAGCSGNACEYISVQKRGGCIVLANSHSQKAIIVKGKRSVPRYVWTVYANSTEVANISGGCMRSWYSLGHEAKFK